MSSTNASTRCAGNKLKAPGPHGRHQKKLNALRLFEIAVKKSSVQRKTDDVYR
jgi:hypothetical protein